MKKSSQLFIIISATLIWYGVQGESVKAKTTTEISSHWPPTNLTGADLTGASLGETILDGVILCNTTMPDGKINNSSCKD